MKKAQFILVAAGLLATSSMISSCKKKEKDPTSVWTINGETFSTNDYIVDKGKAIANFTGKITKYNGFGFVFHSGYFATGSFQVDCGNPDPTYACFGITHNGISYSLPGKTIIATSFENNKPVYHIDSMWRQALSRSNVFLTL